MALGTCPKSGPGSTAEDPLCARVTMGGTARRIENKSDPQYNISLGYMLATHPSMNVDEEGRPRLRTVRSANSIRSQWSGCI